MTPGARVDLTRRPPPGFLGWATCLGLGLGAGSALLVHGLMADPSWPLAIGVGVALGALIPLSVLGGSRVVIADGHLTYFLRGQPCIACAVADIRGFRPIIAGRLRGIGVDIDPAQLEFLSTKGVTRRTCEAHAAGSGCGLVLEFFRDDDLATLRQALLPTTTPSAASAASPTH